MEVVRVVYFNFMGEYQTLDRYFITNRLIEMIEQDSFQPKNVAGTKGQSKGPGSIRLQWPWVWSEKQHQRQHVTVTPMRCGDTDSEPLTSQTFYSGRVSLNQNPLWRLSLCTVSIFQCVNGVSHYSNSLPWEKGLSWGPGV